MVDDIVRYLDGPAPPAAQAADRFAGEEAGPSRYYADGSAEPGRWLGNGAAEMGLSGTARAGTSAACSPVATLTPACG